MDLDAIRSGMEWSGDWQDCDVEFRVRHVCNACECCALYKKRKSSTSVSSNQSESSGAEFDQ
jgi:hypothetical protein